jgi:mono/diheme cytochrome c family protein
MTLRATLALSALFHGLGFGLYADDSKPVLQLDFGQEESAPFIAIGNVVRDQAGPRPPEFPDFEANNTAIQLQGKGSRYEIKDPGPQSPFDFTNGNAITLEAWVKVDKIGHGQPVYLISKGRTNSPHFARNNQNWSLRVIGGSEGLAHLSFLFASAPAPGGGNTWHLWNSTASFQIKSGWHHVAVAYEFGRPETMRGWIDGVATDGDWSVDGATTKAPVVDDDDVWIGSSLGGSAGNSLTGFLDGVAIHRRTLSDAEIAKHRRRKDGPQVVMPEVAKMPEMGKIDEGKVLVQFNEGHSASQRWPNSLEMPKEMLRWSGDAFLLPRMPLRYDDWGIRSAWAAPVLLRMAGDVKLPSGSHRLLLRTRGLARLWVDGKLITETKPAVGNGENGFDPLTPLAEPPHPGVRVKGYKQQEVFGMVTTPPQKISSRVVLELIAGGKNMRTDTGEVCVAIESAGRDAFSILRASSKPELPLTDAQIEPALAEIETSLALLDDANRREAAKSRDSFWQKRHAIAKTWVKQHPAPPPPRQDHPVDAFIDAKIEKALATTATTSAAAKTFHGEVLPILREQCFRCHGEKDKGGLKLNTRDAALRAGDSELAAIVPHDPAASELLKRIRSDDEDNVMPPTGGRLTQQQIARLETWIREGAPWPSPPMDASKLAKTPLTSDAAFLRRIYLDIIGLPPAADEVSAFLADSSPDKRTKLIDRLLADERCADHAMSEWLDALAENPTLINASLNSTGPFRWFLLDSLRDHKPLDRLVTELLMMRGDASHGGSAGFAQAGENDAPFATKGHIIASAFLGVELQCARCHDSPYHSTKQRDLYSLAAMLERKTVTVPKTSRVPAAFFEKKARESLIRVTLKPDEPVTPVWPFAEVTGAAENAGLDALVEDPKDTRERIAALITSPENSRFPRVIVNRIWKRLMGVGFVEPVQDWEGHGASHPELLDWLANELLTANYDVRHIIRIIVTSQAYQREAGIKNLASAGPEERFFHAPARRRLTAEQIVDSLHAAAGAAIDSEPMTFVHDGSKTLQNRQDLGLPRRAWMFASLNNERDRPSLALPRAQAVVNVLEAFGWNGARQKPVFVRESESNVLQPGILENGTLTQSLSRASWKSKLADLAVEAKSPEALLEHLFLRFLNREPLSTERDSFLPDLRSGFENRFTPKDQIVEPTAPKPLRLVTWLNHVIPDANTIQQEIENRVQKGPAPDPRLRSEWREVYEDIVWSLITHRDFVWVP